MSLIDRGDIFDAELPRIGVRPVVVVTRQVAIPLLSSVTVAPITSTVRGIASELALNSEQGLSHPSAANCDNLLTIPKGALITRRGSLRAEDLARLDAALRLALQLD